MTSRSRPSRADLEAARTRTLNDLIRPGLTVLFCGINPGLYSAATGHHFARPGNRFWPTMARSGFTPRLFDPSEEAELLPLGYGITNFVERATASADELSKDEFIAGGIRLREKVLHYQPRFLAMLGVGAFRTAFNAPRAQPGRQPEMLGETILWVLPSPSGLNAHYQAEALASLFRELRLAAG